MEANIVVNLASIRAEMTQVCNLPFSFITSIPLLCQLLGVWLNDGLKRNTNNDYVKKKASKRLYLLKMFRSYGELKSDLLIFYFTVIRCVLEYRAQIWIGSLPQSQKKNIVRIKR